MSTTETVHRYITLDTLEDLRDAAHDRDLYWGCLGRYLRDEVMVVLGMDLGLRACELIELKKSMFRLEQDEVLIPAGIQKDYPQADKSPSAATLELDKYGHFGTIRLLRTYFQTEWWQEKESDYLFPSRQSNQVRTETIRNTVEELAVEAGATVHRTDGEEANPSELHPHALRHSLANYMLKDGDTRLIDVRNRLRHSSILTTEKVYEHFQRR
jgi:integrase/recombinase XerC/integrase/recombinase XerD